MHNLSVKSNIVDSSCSDTTKLGFGGNQPLCPKPRRLRPPMPEFLRPPRCNKHSAPNSEARSGVLTLIADKAFDGRDSVFSGCYPACYSGSPPGRTDNPLVHDVQFIHQKELLSPFSRTKFSDNFSRASTSQI